MYSYPRHSLEIQAEKKRKERKKEDNNDDDDDGKKAFKSGTFFLSLGKSKWRSRGGGWEGGGPKVGTNRGLFFLIENHVILLFLLQFVFIYFVQFQKEKVIYKTFSIFFENFFSFLFLPFLWKPFLLTNLNVWLTYNELTIHYWVAFVGITQYLKTTTATKSSGLEQQKVHRTLRFTPN